MEFYDVIRSRRSFRGYKPDPVPADALERISEAVQLAPTACNRQPFKFLILENPEKRAAVCSVYTQPWLAQAPLIAVVLGDESSAWKRLEGDTIVNVDAAIVMEHLVLSAAAEGLGTCWICAFDRAALDSALGIKAPWKTVAISPIGYPNVPPRTIEHKKKSEIFEVIN